MLHVAHVHAGLHFLEDGFQRSSKAVDWFPIMFYPALLVVVGIVGLFWWYLETRYLPEHGSRNVLRSTSGLSGHTREWSIHLSKRTSGEMELPKNVWSLIVAANLKQVRIKRRIGMVSLSMELGVAFAIIAALFVVVLQVLILYALVLDLNPDAGVVVTKSARPWIHSTWSVNFIKWFMMMFICAGQVDEAYQSMQIVKASLVIHENRNRVHYLVVMVMGFMQYLTMLWTVLTGLAVVLNFDTVADTIYSSMAIGFVSNLDDIVYNLMVVLLDLEVDFKVDLHEHRPEDTWAPSDLAPSDSGEDVGAKASVVAVDVQILPAWLDGILHFLVASPLIWGLYIAAHAWSTNTMPSSKFFEHLRAAHMT